MKKIILFSLICVLYSCNTHKKENKLVGNDLQDGCKGSAGYVWSQLQSKCVRPFETGIKLLPIENSNFAAYLIRKDNKIELFSAETAHSMIFKNKKDSIWVNNEWKIEKKGDHYYLKKSEKLLYNN